MNFFYKYETKYEPLSITNASMPALSDYVGSVNDALVHIDEYQNAIDNRKVQWLKDLWNGIGRTKMNMEKDKNWCRLKLTQASSLLVRKCLLQILRSSLELSILHSIRVSTQERRK